MRLLASLLWASLPVFCVNAKKADKGSFERYQSQFLSSPPLKLDDAAYDQLSAIPRNYSTVVLLTALEARFGCQLCKDFQPEWDLLAKSWAREDKRGETRTVFGTLDFTDGKNTFQKLMLQTAPVVLLFPPTVGQNARPDGQPIRYDFTAGSQTAEQIHSWLSRHLPEGTKPSITRPTDYFKLVTVSTVFLGVITLFSVAYPYVLPIVQNRNLWAAISIITILLFTSGQMFNHIRKVPYVAGDGKGGISYFAGGFSNQFGMETQIVASIYGVLAFATIALAIKVPRMSDPRLQQAAVFIWAGVMLGMYSFLMSVFRIKNGGYPFHLLL